MEEIKILNNNDVKNISMKKAIDVIEECFCNKKTENFMSPPRHYVSNNNGAIVFTVGGNRSKGVFGFRVYDTFNQSKNNQQFVSVYNAENGNLKGLVFGDEIGAVRTGAIGGAAIKLMSRENSSVLGVLGAGKQARTQIKAACAAREINEVNVYSRNRDNLLAFVKDITNELKIKVRPMLSSKEVVKNADILILATNSGQPVFDLSDLKPGVHINSVGPNSKDRHELPAEIDNKANIIFTDSLEQLRFYPEKHFLFGTDNFDQIVDVSKLSGKTVNECRKDEDITLFLSVGLSGTEPIIANLLF